MADEFDHEAVKLGKEPYVHDDRTLMMGKFVLPEVFVPTAWDFDHTRAKFPDHMWGNDNYGDCVIAGEANQILRMQRIETHQTAKLTDDDAIFRYKNLTGCVMPGDRNDNGLEIIVSMRNWRNMGFQTGYKVRNYKIDAYGELDPSDRNSLRAAAYLLHGIQFGFWLPRAAQQMTRDGLWDYNGETGPDWQPGSWGGHCVYSKKFDPDSMSVLTWELEIPVTNAFIERYADEAWAVVDSLDPWRRIQSLDITELEKELGQISGKVNQ